MHELDEVLQHFGVKGMKWGVRHERILRRGSKSAINNAVKKTRERYGMSVKDTKNRKHTRYHDYHNDVKSGIKFMRGNVKNEAKYLSDAIETTRKSYGMSMKDINNPKHPSYHDFHNDVASGIDFYLREGRRRIKKDDLQQGGVNDMHELDEFLLHYGVKGMKWDDKKGEEEQTKEDLKKIKKALTNKIVARLKKAKNAPKNAVKNVKTKVTRDAKFIKEHPIQAVKNATGITKREAKERKDTTQSMNMLRKDNPQAAMAVDVLMKQQRERRAEEKEAWKNVPKIPKLLKKAAIQKAKDKLGITKKEAKQKRVSAILNKLDRNDPKVKKIESVSAPKHIPVKKKATIRPKNLNDLINLKMDTNDTKKRRVKRESRALPR